MQSTCILRLEQGPKAEVCTGEGKSNRTPGMVNIDGIQITLVAIVYTRILNVCTIYELIAMNGNKR
jgi:hypothetical protein